MDDYKKAALCLHGLHEADQSWLLAQLPDSQRSELGGMLQELETLGIPKDRSWLPGVHGAEAYSSLEQSIAQSSCVGELERADPARIGRVLKGEPEPLIAALIGIREWPWRKALLAGCKRRLRKKLLNQAAGKQTLLTARTRSTILELLAQRLRECDGGGASVLTERRPKPKMFRRPRWRR